MSLINNLSSAQRIFNSGQRADLSQSICNEARSIELCFIGNQTEQYHNTQTNLQNDVSNFVHVQQNLQITGKGSWYTDPNIGVTYRTGVRI